ncbi:HlyD family efflux transporter periplasmic adaptor subunit [bacterium]|nr:HlyD family efflux transporter periplasmic adaptor subunit [bacterium]
MFKVSGTKKQQIEVYITADEYQYLQDDKPVEVVYQDQSLTGTIDAISTVADKTNLFKATIQLDTDVSLL